MHLFLETTSAGGGMGSMIIMMVAVVAVMYFLMIRPENEKKKEAEQMRSAVKVGDKIITIGGVVGVVCAVKDDKIVIETSATGFGWSLPNGRFLPTRPRTRRRRLSREGRCGQKARQGGEESLQGLIHCPGGSLPVFLLAETPAFV